MQDGQHFRPRALGFRPSTVRSASTAGARFQMISGFAKSLSEARRFSVRSLLRFVAMQGGFDFTELSCEVTHVLLLLWRLSQLNAEHLGVPFLRASLEGDSFFGPVSAGIVAERARRLTRLFCMRAARTTRFKRRPVHTAARLSYQFLASPLLHGARVRKSVRRGGG